MITFMVSVLGPDGQEVPYEGPILSKLWNADDVLSIGPKSEFKFVVDLVESASKGVRFPEPRKDASPKARRDYLALVDRERAHRLYPLHQAGEYRVSAKYWIAGQFKDSLLPEVGKGLWVGETESKPIEVSISENAAR